MTITTGCDKGRNLVELLIIVAYDYAIIRTSQNIPERTCSVKTKATLHACTCSCNSAYLYFISQCRYTLNKVTAKIPNSAF